MIDAPTKLFIITGSVGAGKSAFCARLIEPARSAGLKIGGILSPGIFENGQKIAINAIDLSSGQSTILATLRSSADQAADLQTPRWQFSSPAMAWGNAVLQTATPCDLLVVDELGPLEFEQNRGWTAGFAALDSGLYQAGVVVIRPSLLGMAQQRWPLAQVVNLGAFPSPIFNIPSELLHLIDRNRRQIGAAQNCSPEKT